MKVGNTPYNARLANTKGRAVIGTTIPPNAIPDIIKIGPHNPRLSVNPSTSMLFVKLVIKYPASDSTPKPRVKYKMTLICLFTGNLIIIAY